MGLKYEKPEIKTYREEEILKENAKLLRRGRDLNSKGPGSKAHSTERRWASN